MALSVLDEHFAEAPGGPRSTAKQRWTRRQKGLPNYRLIRYADDFVILVSGTTGAAEALLPEVADVLSTVGLRLSEEKTLITHIDEGLDFLGWRIQRHRKRGTTRQYVYNYPAEKALRSVKAKCKTICRMNVSLPLAVLLHQLNPVLRGWTAYFRPGCPPRLPVPAHDRLASGIRMAAAQAPECGLEGTPPPLLRRPMVAARRRGRRCSTPVSVVTTRYRPRGTTIPSPWPSTS